MLIKPPVKWIGGKRQLLPELVKLLPKKYNKYIEPFFGGGALFFYLQPEYAIINDSNWELINFYQIVKNNPNDLIDDLKYHQNTSDYFYAIRNVDRTSGYGKISNLKKASRFIYLNKTCYNGLFRVNKKNQFNAPFGRYKNPTYLDVENLIKCSNVLQHTTILNNDFTIIKDYIQKNDFVYFDPPYHPVSKTSNFTSYTKDSFGEKQQIELKYLCDYIDNVGAYFLLSNSYSEFILNLYKDYDINTVRAKRYVNSDPKKRGDIKEVLIRNY